MAEYRSHKIRSSKIGVGSNDEKKSLQLRVLVRELYYQRHVSRKMIERQLKVSRKFVRRWTGASEQDVISDRRGWPKGKRRTLDSVTIERVKEIHQFLEHDPLHFYSGATAIAQEFRNRYRQDVVPSLRTIGRILADAGLSGHRRTAKAKGAARYLCYPEHTIYKSGRVLEADFIGKKYLGGGEPLNFIGFSFKQSPKLRHFQYVTGQTTDEIINHCRLFFDRFEKPDYMKVDNCGATIGSGNARRTLSRFVCFLLDNRVIPIFSVPRKPFSQASIEGNNSVFSRKFWNSRTFTSREDVCRQLEWFNQASERYTEYSLPSTPRSDPEFVPQLLFIRQVAADKTPARTHAQAGFISVLNEKITLPASYINYFVLARWHLKHERLEIYFEKEQIPKCIKRMKFTINEKTKFKGVPFI